ARLVLARRLRAGGGRGNAGEGNEQEPGAIRDRRHDLLPSRPREIRAYGGVPCPVTTTGPLVEIPREHGRDGPCRPAGWKEGNQGDAATASAIGIVRASQTIKGPPRAPSRGAGWFSSLGGHWKGWRSRCQGTA